MAITSFVRWATDAAASLPSMVIMRGAVMRFLLGRSPGQRVDRRGERRRSGELPTPSLPFLRNDPASPVGGRKNRWTVCFFADRPRAGAGREAGPCPGGAGYRIRQTPLTS